MAAVDPRRWHPFEREEDHELPSLTELVESFLDAGLRQTDALLKVVAAVSGDELLRERIRRAVIERRHPIPGWLLRLDRVEPYRAIEMTHVLGDGDNVAFGARLPGRREITAVVYIDHNLGTVVKDAFVLDIPIADAIDAWNRLDAGATEVNEKSLADARARITAASDAGATTFPPLETDTWPACRPLVEWLVTMMPEGGVGYDRPERSEKQLARLAGGIFGSDFGLALDDVDHRALLESILWYGTDYGPGDPLRWSPVAVEILLDDWLVRKVMAPVDFLEKAPAVLRAFVRYYHTERRIPRELTADTLAAIDEYEPDYQRAIRSQGRSAPMALLKQAGSPLGAIDLEDLDRGDGLRNDGLSGDGLSHEEYMLEVLAREVGGFDVLDRLVADPLPDEAFGWAAVPEDIRPRVAEVLDQLDGCAEALFDTEFRTATRRFLAWVAGADPEIFRRKSSSAMSAAAVCWVIAKANDYFGGWYGRGAQVKELMAHFGLSGSASQRAEVMLRAVGADWRYGRTNLGDPELLVSSKRDRLITLHDRYRATDGA